MSSKNIRAENGCVFTILTLPSNSVFLKIQIPCAVLNLYKNNVLTSYFDNKYNIYNNILMLYNI